MLRPIAIVCAMVAGISSFPSRADACFCSPPVHVAPADGTTGVPLNSEVVVANARLGEVSLFRDGIPVPTEDRQLWTSSTWSMIALRPVAPLPSNATFEVKLGTIVLASFETGTESDDVAPDAPSFAPTIARASADSSSCGDAYIYVALGLSDVADVASYEITIESTSSTTSLELFPTDLDALSGYSMSTCDVRLLVTADEESCVTVRALDLARNPSGSVTECTVADECAKVGGPGSFDGDLSDCPPPGASGCSSSQGESQVIAVAIVFLLGWRLRRPTSAART